MSTNTILLPGQRPVPFALNRKQRRAASSAQQNAPTPAEVRRVLQLFSEQQYAAAEQAARALTARYPHDGFGFKALAAILDAQKQWPEALAICERSSKLIEQDPEFHNNFGNILRQLNRSAEAESHYRRAIALRPKYVETWDNLGVLLHQTERLDEAETCFLKALALAPEYAPAYAHLGNLLLVQCRIPEAEHSYREALRLEPNSAQTHNNLGSLLHGAGRNAEAEACLRQAVTLDPHYAPAYNSLGHLLAEHGFHADAEACFRATLHLQPDHAVAHSNLLFSMAHRSEVSPEALFAEHRAFSQRFEQALKPHWPAHTHSRDPERPLRIAIVSGDLHDHALIRYLRPMLQQLQRYPEFILHAYSNDMIEDAVTAELKSYFHKWRQISFLTDTAFAAELQADSIDIVLDLSGHTGYNRLLALARKPAPLQISWIGYVGTTGMDAMDYFIADKHFLPPAFRAQFSEKIMYLPACTPFAPHPRSPEVQPLPALTNGNFTFGSFNRIMKLSREVIALWSEILRAEPASHLLLAAMREATPPSLLLNWFAEEGIARERLTFLGARGVEPTLRLHHQVDLCLDPFPYSGSTTSNHALWMGVPTLTLPGATVPGRMGVALANHVGLEGFVATDKADYVAKALHWARHPEQLAELRPQLRQRFADSIFLKPDVITDALALSLRTAWRRWCAGLPAETLDVTSSLDLASSFAPA